MAILVLLATAVTACSSPSAGTPTAASDPAAPSSTGARSDGSAGHLPTDGAPTVQHPLDLRRYQQNPCSALTATQLQQLGVAARGRAQNQGVGPECDWDDAFGSTGVNLGVIFSAGGEGGLSDVYANRGKFASFQPISDIGGYPAVFANPANFRDLGLCYVYVGISDQSAPQISIHLRGGATPAPNFHNPCGVAVVVARAMVSTFETGGS